MNKLAVAFFVISFIFVSNVIYVAVAVSGEMCVFDKVSKETSLSRLSMDAKILSRIEKLS